MIYIGVDPGIRSPGVVWVSPDGFLLARMEYCDSKRSLNSRGVVSDAERCIGLGRTFERWLSNLPSDTIMACIEGPAFVKGQSRSIQTGGVHYSIYSALFGISGTYIVTVPPKVLKKYVSGSGNASKELVVESVRRRWGGAGCLTGDDHDAFALAMFGVNLVKIGCGCDVVDIHVVGLRGVEYCDGSVLSAIRNSADH